MRIAVLFGGTSEERDVSIASAAQVIPALRARGHEVIGIDTASGRLAPAAEQRLLQGLVASEPPSDRAIAAVRSRAITLSPQAFDVRDIDVVFLASPGSASASCSSASVVPPCALAERSARPSNRVRKAPHEFCITSRCQRSCSNCRVRASGTPPKYCSNAC